MTQFDGDAYQKKLRQVELLREKKRLKEGLPHLYRWKNYQWSKEFIESSNRMNLLCAANQISKSSTLIRKNIIMATEADSWPKFWDTKPQVFWYVYPDRNKIKEEFEIKWVRENLPQGDFQNHPKYGFKIDWEEKGLPRAIYFRSGIILVFKTWGQDLQAGTCHMVSCDEELPEDLYPEISMRLSRYDGIFNMVFTATLNQPFWHDAIEKRGKGERFPQAFKRQVSMYDCQTYVDGSPGPWTNEKIEKEKAKIGTQREILRRVYGRFVTAEGLKYPSFDRNINVKAVEPVPKDWIWYSGVDIGSGGPNGHKSVIAFIAVRPDFRFGRVVRCWAGDDFTNTTSGDVVEQYQKMAEGIDFAGQYYDYSAKDFETYATRAGLAFSKAEKAHDVGEDLLNTLFKNQMLALDDTEENQELAHEFLFLRTETKKQHAKDDRIDGVRYAAVKIPWDFSHITGELIKSVPEKKVMSVDEQRRHEHLGRSESQEDIWDPLEEIGFWNEQY